MKIHFLLMFLIANSISWGQIKATTEQGKEVTLFKDGTWIYGDQAVQDSLSLNSKIFVKDANSTTLLKSKKTSKWGLWYDKSDWSFTENKSYSIESPHEYMFLHKNSACYGMSIIEVLDVDLDNYSTLLDNVYGKKDYDYNVVKSEKRMVNGKEVIMKEYKMVVNGLKVYYMTYIYVEDGIATQISSYTSTSQFTKNKPIMESFLNGLVILK